MSPALQSALDDLDASAKKLRRAGFTHYVQAILECSDERYALWLRANGLDGFTCHDDRLSLIRARLRSSSPLLSVNQTNVCRWNHCGAIIREGREARRLKRVAQTFAPRMAEAAE